VVWCIRLLLPVFCFCFLWEQVLREWLMDSVPDGIALTMMWLKDLRSQWSFLECISLSLSSLRRCLPVLNIPIWINVWRLWGLTCFLRLNRLLCLLLFCLFCLRHW
jgi:Putative p-aminobenzoyl-glutamate transporter